MTWKTKTISIIKIIIYAVIFATAIEIGWKALLLLTIVIFVLKRKQIIQNMKLGGKFVEWKLKQSQNNK